MLQRDGGEGSAEAMPGLRSAGAGAFLDEEARVALRLWVAMARAQAAIGAREQRDLSRRGLTRGELGVLDALYFKGPLLVGEIQRKLLVSSGGMTYLIDRLEERGHVERRRAPEDRRSVYAALTPEGEAYFEEIFPGHARGLASSVSVLSQEEQVRLTALLKKVGKRAAELLQEDLKGPTAV
ncbi:MAG: MarR family transcriptional regulator [Gemmatimonadales bacterium]|nr:MAG: MarR family transcriptional regulator [Gemmatimonadales bacterium]